MNTNTKTCPVCGCIDKCQFVFVEAFDNKGLTLGTTNPSDFHFIFVCPNLHVYDEGGHGVKVVDLNRDEQERLDEENVE